VLAYTKVIEVVALTLMALQKQGYACISRQAGPAARAVVS